jgi:hypothetical protein
MECVTEVNALSEARLDFKQVADEKLKKFKAVRKITRDSTKPRISAFIAAILFTISLHCCLIYKCAKDTHCQVTQKRKLQRKKVS